MRFKWSTSACALLIALAALTVPAGAQPVPTMRGQATGPSDEGSYTSARGREITVVKGWNSVHAYSCFLSGSGKKTTITLISRHDEKVTLKSARPEKLPMMIAQCATGNWISFFVTKVQGKTFLWTNLQSWSYS